MSEQVPDTCTLDDRKWIIEQWHGDLGCIPSNEELGIETVSPHTGNWSGRIDHFLVFKGQLFLFKIEAHLADSCQGIRPKGARREVLLRYEPWDIFDKDGERSEIRECREEFLIFDDLTVSFTGTLYLARPYYDDWNIPQSAAQGYDPEMSYARLIFDSGKLVDFYEINAEELVDPCFPPTESKGNVETSPEEPS